MSISIQRRRWIWISLAGLWLGSVPSITQALDTNDILQAHNIYRATHQAGALAWSSSLAQAAQNWANTCPSDHSPRCSAPYIPPGQEGFCRIYEDLSKNYTVNYPTNDQQFYNDHNSGKSYGHFTQVIWRSTTQLGCAQATCNTGWRYVTVCQYAPAGNFTGQFLQNVKAPSEADLVPATPAGAIPGPPGFCQAFDVQGRLLVNVTNQGSAPAPASVTVVTFYPGGSVEIPTASVAVGSSVTLPVKIPGACFSPDCAFRITVDSKNTISEGDETNNTAGGSCLG